MHENPGSGSSLQITDSFTERIAPDISNESACFILIFLKIQALFQPVSDWYQNLKSSVLIGRYLYLVNFIVSRRAVLQNCLVSCKHCQIPFITYPCNAGRKDLGCPFGCREFLRSENSKKRSIEYYQTDDGKKTKKRLNQKRCLDLSEKPQDNPQLLQPVSSPSENNISDDLTTKDRWISYLQSVVSFIEGRRFSGEEIANLVKILRQHSLDQDASKRYSRDKEPNSS